jgi:hypothetical protein
MLISSKPNAGKSRSIEQLPAAELKRTIYIDIEGKGSPNLFDDDFYKVVRIKPSGLIAPERAHLYTDSPDVLYKTLAELQIYIRKALASPKIDRLVIDSFTALVDQLESHFVTVHNGFTVWATYSKELTEWFTLLKEETRFHAKFVYVLGHYVPSKDPKDTEGERFTKVKGTMHYRMVESHFNSVLTLDDHKFIADNENEWDSTRIHEKLNPLETTDNSIQELEQIIADTFLPAKK